MTDNCFNFQLFFESEPNAFGQYQIGVKTWDQNQNQYKNTKSLATCSVVAPPGAGTGTYWYALFCWKSMIFYATQMLSA